MDSLRLLVSLMLERAIKEEDVEESSGASAAVGTMSPLGTKPLVIDPEKPTSRRRKGRRTNSSAFGNAKQIKQ